MARVNWDAINSKITKVSMWTTFAGEIHLIFSFRFITNVVAFESSTKFRFSASYEPTTVPL